MGEANQNPVVYGAVNPFVVNEGEVFDIIINNLSDGIHPFHLHGRHFQVIDRQPSGAGSWNGSRVVGGNPLPPTRDTLDVYPNSHAVYRLRADDPGVFLFHCHIEWHVEFGMVATLIEAPERLRNLPIPPDHLANCQALDIPAAGNAAANAVNPLDVSGVATVPPTVYNG